MDFVPDLSSPVEDDELPPVPDSALQPISTASEPAPSIPLDFVKELEGWNPNAYGDFKQYSIGWGTRARNRAEVIDEAEGERRLASELTSHAKRVDDAAANYGLTLTPGQRDALVSFDFNTGKAPDVMSSKDPEAIANRMVQYNKAGGKLLPGLVSRRKAEIDRFWQPGDASANGQGDTDEGFVPDLSNPIEEPFVPDLSSAEPPPIVAGEAVKATAGATQALDVMSAPLKLDWSDIQNERDAQRYTEAQTFRAMAKIAEENGSGTGPGSEAFNLRRLADAVEAEILPHTEAGQRMTATGAGQLQSIEEAATTQQREAAVTPYSALSSFMGPALTEQAGAVAEGAGRNLGAATGGMLAAARFTPAAPVAAAAPIASTIFSTVAAMMGGMAGSQGQEGLLQSTETPEETQGRAERTAETEAQYPIGSRIGMAAASLPVFKPSVGEIYKALKGNPEALRNVATAAGIGAGASLGANAVAKEPLNIAEAVVSALENMLMNNPTRLGRALGFHPSTPVEPTASETPSIPITSSGEPSRTSISEVITPAPDRTSIDEVIKRNQPREPLPTVDGDAGISTRATTSTADAFANVPRKAPTPPAETPPTPAPPTDPARAAIEAEAQKVGPIRYDGDTQMGDDGFYYFSDTTSKPGTTISFTVESKGPPSAEAIAAKHAERLAAFGVELPKAPPTEEAPLPPPEPGPPKATEEPPLPPPETPPTPTEAKPTTEGPIGIRNAVTGALRKELGLPERVTPELRNFDTLHTEATEALKADPEAGNRLVTKLESEPGMMLSDTQDAIATFELNRRRMARNEASRRVNEAKTPEEREAAMEDFTRLDDATIKMIGLLERTGTESARGLNARRLMLNADYSLSRMLENTRTIRNGGEKLSPEQVKEVTELHAKIEDLEKRIAEKETGEAASAAKRTFDQVLRQTQKEAKSAAKSKKSIVDFLSEKEAEAKKRIVERRGRLQVTIDPLNIAGLVDEAIIGAAHIARGVRDFGAWSKRMLADFGERIKPALKGLWDKSNELHAGYETEFKAASKAKTPKEILEKLDPKKDGPTQKQVFDLARAHINEGVEGFEPVMEATRKDLETVYPDITTRQVHDAYSQYGKTTIPSKDADLVKLREYRALSRLQSQLEDAINKIPPLKTGPQRDKATARVRELQKQVKDAMRKAGIEPRSEEDQLTSSLGAAKTRMRNEIEEMAKAIETKTPRTENKSKLEYDAEAKALKEKLDAKRAEYESVFGKNEKTIEERQAEAIKSLDARIAEEDALLQAGTAKRPKTGTPIPETAEMTRKKAELEAMRKLRRELAKEAKPPKDEATIARERLASDKKRIRTATEKLRERIKAGDYEPRKRREPEMDQEKIDLLYEKQQIQREFNEGLIESKRARRGAGRKIFDAGTETLNLVRQVLTSGDLPPILRQGLFTLANPTVSAPAVARSINSMLSSKRRFAEDLKIKNNPDHRLAEISGLNLPNAETTSLVKQEEEHAGRFFRELPRWTVLGPLLRMSERSYNTFISSIRMDLFSKMLKTYGVDKTDLVTTKRVADIINTITGRASLPGKKLEQAAPALNMALFATRYTMSRFKVALGEPLWTGNAKTRTFALEQYGRLLAGAAAIYGIANMFGAEVETDPRSANFGKINIGEDGYLDPMAGLTQVTTLMTRLITGETKTSKSGELVPLRESMRPLQTVAPHLAAKGKPNMLIGDTTDILKQFARTKLAPVPGEIVNLLAGADLSGKPARFGGKIGGVEVPGAGTLSRVGAPISFQDILKTMERQGVPKGAAVWVLSLFGAGLQQRDKQEKTGGMRLSL